MAAGASVKQAVGLSAARNKIFLQLFGYGVA